MHQWCINGDNDMIRLNTDKSSMTMANLFMIFLLALPHSSYHRISVKNVHLGYNKNNSLPESMISLENLNQHSDHFDDKLLIQLISHKLLPMSHKRLLLFVAYDAPSSQGLTKVDKVDKVTSTKLSCRNIWSSKHLHMSKHICLHVPHAEVTYET